MKIFKKFKEYCETVYEEPMPVGIFVGVMAMMIGFLFGGTVGEGLIHWAILIVPLAFLILLFGGMYLLGRYWTKIDKK